MLKNALDWASRPYGRASLSGKAVVVVVVTPGATKLRRDAEGRAMCDDAVGRRLLIASWAGLEQAIARGAGAICQAGSVALAALPRS